MRKEKIGWTLIILNLIGYFGNIATGKKIPINIFNISELLELIGYNLMLIIGLIMVLSSKKKIK